MSTLATDLHSVSALEILFSEDELVLRLNDGRTLLVPLAWYPRLLNGTSVERQNWRLIGDGEGIHWPDLDEDISVENAVLGHRSGEGQASLKRWLENRKRIHTSG